MAHGLSQIPALATGLDASGHRLLEHSRNSLVAAATASAAEAEKAAQFVKTYTDNISKWVVDENVEAKDKTGRWYRSTVRGVRCRTLSPVAVRLPLSLSPSSVLSLSCLRLYLRSVPITSGEMTS